jgi:hypothetical protein
VYTEDFMHMQGHTMMSHSSHRHTEVDALDCREETYLLEHGGSSPLKQYTDLGDHLRGSSSFMSHDRWRVID